ncbi:hypothetical protein GCM10027456_26690 [Kineosporia babensis]
MGRVLLITTAEPPLRRTRRRHTMAKILKARDRRPARKIEVQPKKKNTPEAKQPARGGRD